MCKEMVKLETAIAGAVRVKKLQDSWGRQVRQIRLALNLTPHAFADKLRLSMNGLKKVEDGRASYTLCFKAQRGLRLLLAERMALKMTRLPKPPHPKKKPSQTAKSTEDQQHKPKS